MRLKKIISLIILFWFILTMMGGFGLRLGLPGRSDSEVPEENNTSRIAFFSDIHMQNSEIEAETDIGAPSSKIPKNTKSALNNANPDYIFTTGDYTAQSELEEWRGAKNWIDKMEAPVFGVLGNHDREHFPGGAYAEGYFSELEKESATKVLKFGNNVFILVSEEHNPEFNSEDLDATIPQKRFEFIEKYLKKYSDSNNIFIINHTPLSGTTAYSRTWYYGANKNWIHITNKFMDLLDNYDVTAQISGHVHTDYRQRDIPGDHDKTTGVENVGKFVNGEKITNSARIYPPYRLPETYFLNMPAANLGQAWSSNFYFIAFPKGNPTTQTEEKEPIHLQLQSKYEEVGPSFTDILHSPRTSSILGRSAVYYADFTENQDQIKMITRWASGNRDMESYEVELEHPVELGDGSMQFIASDLSLRGKENLIITRDNWFKVEAGNTGIGTFSKRLKENKQFETGEINIENYNLKNYSVQWWGKQNLENDWQKVEKFDNNPGIKAVKIKVSFEASSEEDAFIEDINLSI